MASTRPGQPPEGEAKPSYLPPPRTRLIGRQQELDAIEARFADGARLVTLTGMGGIGKSRIATEIARRRQARDAHAGETTAWSCRLGPMPSELETVRAIAKCMGLEARSAEVAEIIDAIAYRVGSGGACLMVFDAFEHALPMAEAILGKLLDVSEEPLFLVTSREALRVEGEHVLPIGPMAMRDAVTLFRERSLAAGAPMTAVEDDASLARIVDQLGAMPIAIEIASAQMTALSAEELAAKLAAPLTLLDDRSDRSAYLRRALEDALDQLDPTALDVFLRLSLFVGAFSVEDARAVLAHLPGTTVDLALAELRRRALLTQATAPTGKGSVFRLLDPLRELGRRRVHAMPEAHLVREGFARCCAERGAELAAHFWAHSDPDVFLASTSLRIDLLRIALDESLELSTRRSALFGLEPGLHHHAWPREVESLLRPFFDDPSATARDRARLLAISIFAGVVKVDRHALSTLPSLRSDELDSLPPLEHSMLVNAEILLAWFNDAPLEAETASRALIEVAEREGYRGLAVIGLHALHASLWLQGRFEESGVAASRGFETARAIGHPSKIVSLGLDCHEQALLRNDLTLADRIWRELTPLLGERISIVAQMHALAQRAGYLLMRGDLEAARSFVLDGVTQFESRTGTPANRLAISTTLACAELELGDVVTAHARLALGNDGTDDRPTTAFDPMGSATLAVASAALGFSESAERLVRRALDYAGAASPFRRAFELVEALVAVISSRRAGEATGAEARARTLLALGDTPRTTTFVPSEERLVERWLRSTLDGSAAFCSEGRPQRVQVLGFDRAASRFTWMAREGDLANHPLFARLLTALVDAHERSPGTPPSFAALIAAGWPGERILPEAARNRLRVAIRRMRSLGLEGALVTAGDTYMVSPTVVLRSMR